MNPYERLLRTYEDLGASPRLSMNKTANGAAAGWVSAGPLNIAGRVRALAIHPSNPNTIFAASASGGVWKTTNFGNEWFPISDQLPALACGAIAIDRNNPDRIFLGTGEPITMTSTTHGFGSPAYYGVGVIRTDDGGANWTAYPWPNGKSMIHRLALHPADSDTLFAASTSDLWKSTNGGQNWSRVLSGVATEVLYAPGNPSRVYAALGSDNGSSSNGIYVSDAGGKNFSWRKLTANFPRADSTGRILIAVSESNPNRVYAAVALNRGLLSRTVARDPNDFFMVLLSSDGGETWERKPNAIARSFTNSQAYYDLVLGVSPTNPNLVFLGGVDLWRSTNGGANFVRNTDWSLRTSNPGSPRYAHADHHALIFKPGDPNSVIIGTDGGVHISTNTGDTWAIKSYKMTTTQFYGVTSDATVPYRIYGGTQDQSNMRQSSAGDVNWAYLGGGDGCAVAVDPKLGNVLYIVINGSPYRSTNSGSSFNRIESGMNAGPTADREYYWRPMALHPINNTILFISCQYMYRMRNAPTASDPQWELVSPDLTRGSAITDFATPKDNGDWMYAVTGDGKAWLSQNILATDPTWTDISAGLPNRWITRVHIDPDDYHTIYVSVSGYGAGHAFKSTNAGQNWTNITGDLPDLPAGSILRSRTDQNLLFLATDFGVWYSVNGGVNWKQYSTGLPNCVVYDMAMGPDGNLIAATFGRGMWVTSSVVPVEETATAGRDGFTLGQNYPNPVGAASSSTSIPFFLAKSGLVRLAVYDAAGRTVRTLVDGARPAGESVAVFDASGLPNGVYYYAMESGGQRQIRKLSVLR
ncbi:MAG: T9SS type A sorting domain-containing protein [Ignavibacteria bacterium]|nr:T9SS type A sorting domain-containing protein [Ignavibacteria bacterium]